MQIETQNPTGMTESSRRRRIAELLCKAILLAEANDAVAAAERAAGVDVATEPDQVTSERNEESDRVLQFLSVVREASPATIRESLGISRSTVYRALQRLAREQQVIAEGQTRMIVYRLNQAEPPPEKIELN
jgi:DNA-binding transcriptional ArsR family regulator